MKLSKFSEMEKRNIIRTMGIPMGQLKHHPDNAAPHTCTTQRQSSSSLTFQAKPCLHFSTTHSKNTFPPHLSKGANTAAVHLESSYRVENNQRLLAQCRWGQTMKMTEKGVWQGVNELCFSFMATPQHDNTCVCHKRQSWMTSSCNYCCIRAWGGPACSRPLEDCSHR